VSIDELVIVTLFSSYSTQVILLLKLEIHKPSYRLTAGINDEVSFESRHGCYLAEGGQFCCIDKLLPGINDEVSLALLEFPKP
jgi:hypothetical protein